MKDQTTKKSWRLLPTDDKQVSIIRGNDGTAICTVINEDHGKEIIVAVNCHDEFIKAFKGILDCDGYDSQRMHDIARQALSNASHIDRNEVDSETAFEGAITVGRLSAKKGMIIPWAGDYMYMGTKDGKTLFKHIDTRQYLD